MSKKRKRNGNLIEGDNDIQMHNTTEAHQKPIKTFNRYADLSENNQEVNHSIPDRPTKTKIPPIVVINLEYIKIMNLLKNINISNFNLKYISMGIKIMCSSLENYTSISISISNT